MNLTGSVNNFHKSLPNLKISMKIIDPVNMKHESTTNLRNNNSRNIYFISSISKNPENRIRKSDLNKYSRTVKEIIVYTSDVRE